MTIKNCLICVSIIFALNVSSLTCSVRLKNERRDSRVWNVCIYKIPHLIKIGAEGTLAVYAAYLALDWAMNMQPAVITLINNIEKTQGPYIPLLKDLLKKSCTMLGLSFLALKSTEACVQDLDIL